ncbi:MAG: hypothetical protein RL129_45 [Actinomycetota bacterium]|jgi:hypothetical protein
MKSIRVVVIAICSLVLSGCASSQMYAKDKIDGVYFTVPNGWTKISQNTLNSREAQSKATGAADRLSLVTWQEAYSMGGDAKAADVFSLKAPKSPLVYVRVRDLSIDEVQSVSYNSLRDIIVPLTDWINKGASTKDFQLIDDYERVEKGARGVRTIFSFIGTDGAHQTIDQTALVTQDHSKIYVLLVRAKSSDYQSSQKMLTKIGDSLTIRGTK